MSSLWISSKVKKLFPRLWYFVVERWTAYYEPRKSEEFFRHYLSDMTHHPSYAFVRSTKLISMLHEEVLMLLRLFVISSRGTVLEIGSYVGGATIVLAATAKEFRKAPVISIEAGGAHDHPHIPTKDIFSDLLRNVETAGISDHVKLLKGFSADPVIVETVKQASDHKKIDLLIIDADGGVERDIATYNSLLNFGAVIVLDDYTSAYAPEKAQATKQWVDHAMATGTVRSLGVWGWGTWIGIYLPGRS